jgi:hypothetical protein
MIEELYEYWWYSNWVNFSLFTYTYDVNNNMIEELEKYWDGFNWVNSRKQTYTYDGNNNMIEQLVQNWGGSNWVNEFYITYTYSDPIPVELTSFAATSQTGKVYLNWTTASEINNLGFEIQRKILINQNEGEWVRIGFVNGHGTTTEPKEYSYIDDINTIEASSLVYRLKQIDFLGSYEYSDEVYVENPAPMDYALHQNYPNPFNPTTSIKYGVAVKSHIVMKVFNALGSEVAILVNKEKPIGSYEVEFDATGLPSGIYFYQLVSGTYSETRKMNLLK